MRSTATVMIVMTMMALALVSPARVAVADAFHVELVHPQSDDAGHYVAFAQVTNATIFGTVAPAENVKAIIVNDRVAQLFPGELAPFGGATGAKSLEFRATVELEPKSKVNITVHGVGGETAHVTLEPSAGAVVDRLRELVKQHPDSARDRCRLGGALRDSGKLEEAIAEFRESLGQDMSCVNTRVSLGLALVQIGRPEDALKEFSLAADTVPDFAMAWLNLGLVHARFTRNTAQAVRCFKRYLELEPDSSLADKVKRYIEAHQ